MSFWLVIAIFLRTIFCRKKYVKIYREIYGDPIYDIYIYKESSYENQHKSDQKVQHKVYGSESSYENLNRVNFVWKKIYQEFKYKQILTKIVEIYMVSVTRTQLRDSKMNHSWPTRSDAAKYLKYSKYLYYSQLYI